MYYAGFIPTNTSNTYTINLREVGTVMSDTVTDNNPNYNSKNSVGWFTGNPTIPLSVDHTNRLGFGTPTH